MARARFKKEDYMKIAKTKGLEHLGSTPANVKMKTKWRCLRCGKRMNRTYRGIALGKGCSCRDPRTKQEADYRALAAELGIVWVYDPKNVYSFPTNTKDLSVWQNAETGEEVYITWHELTHHIRSDLRIALGLGEEYA